MSIIYLDHHATTPVDRRVIDTMIPYLTDHFANAGSAHWFGREVSRAINQAREQVAQLIHASSSEVYFTSGATESNNIVIQGVAECCHTQGKHIITSKIEHPAVLYVCQALESKGFEVSYVDCDEYGMIHPETIQKHLRLGAAGTTERTVLVSIMGANNEVGTINPIVEIAKICHQYDILFHVDGAQYVGKLPVNVQELDIDFLSFSGHKMYAPKGVGGLYVRRSLKDVACKPLMFGGGQEGGLRPGTQPVPLFIALGKACEIVSLEIEQEMAHHQKLVDFLWKGIQKRIPDVKLNGHPQKRLSGNLNVTFVGIDAEVLMLRMHDIAVSTGSACSSMKKLPSHVLAAMGLDRQTARAAVRFGIGRDNTIEQLEEVISVLEREVACLREKLSTSEPVEFSTKINQNG